MRAQAVMALLSTALCSKKACQASSGICVQEENLVPKFNI